MFTKPYDTVALAKISKKTAYYSDQETLTQQQFLEESDINVMIRRFTQSPSTMPDPVQGLYFDHTQFAALADAKNTQIQLDEEFSALPSLVRQKFRNDSQTYAQHLIAQSDLKTTHEKEDFYKKMTSPIQKVEDAKIHAAAEKLLAARKPTQQTPTIINKTQAAKTTESTDKS